MTVANAASQKSESLCPGFSSPLFQEECRQDPVFLQQVCSLERMLRVRTRTEEEVKIAGAAATAGATAGTLGLLEAPELEFSEAAKTARAAATTSECVGIIGSHQVLESVVARSSLIHESSLARSCADVGESCAGGFVSASAAPCVAALPAGRSLTYARAAANACGEVASVSNSGSFSCQGPRGRRCHKGEVQPPYVYVLRCALLVFSQVWVLLRCCGIKLDCALLPLAQRMSSSGTSSCFLLHSSVRHLFA